MVGAVFSLSLGVAYAVPFQARIGWIVGTITGVLVVIGLVRSSPVIEVRDGVLYAGRAHIDIDFLETLTPLDRNASLELRGPGANPLAWMLLRRWIPTAVRVDLNDPDDPTPYWFISTRKPVELVRALQG
jgi:hypothetical protein